MCCGNVLALDVANTTMICQQFEVYRREYKKRMTTIELLLLFKGIEMEKSKAPSFSGKTIDYPEFKNGWQKIPEVINQIFIALYLNYLLNFA